MFVFKVTGKIIFENGALERIFKSYRYLFTYQNLIPARNVIDVHARDLVVNDGLLILIVKAFARCILSLCDT